MHFTSFVAIAALIGLAAATPSATPVAAAFAGDGEVVLTTESGCGSSGPLGPGHYEWYIVVSCNPGGHYTCQATDASGCVPGDPKHIGSMEVDDPDDTFNVARASNTNTLPFTCPSIGQVRCEANFNDNYDGPNYSLRVFSS